MFASSCVDTEWRRIRGNLVDHPIVIQDAEDLTTGIDSPLQLRQDVGGDIC